MIKRLCKNTKGSDLNKKAVEVWCKCVPLANNL